MVNDLTSNVRISDILGSGGNTDTAARRFFAQKNREDVADLVCDDRNDPHRADIVESLKMVSICLRVISSKREVYTFLTNHMIN